MIIQRLITIFFLIFIINAISIDQIIKPNTVRHRRNLDLMNWLSADVLFKQLYANKNHLTDEDIRMKRSQIQQGRRPVEGPINIEQLPAMLESRNVKRYPYSQQDDPALIGR